MNNPFVFDRPNNIDVNEFIQFYIKDNIYTRFLESTRNLVLIGVRGSGKTSTLRYFSFPVQFANENVEDKYSIIGIHIPCKHPIFGKREYLLYEKTNKQFVVVEHFLCINILASICDTFLEIKDQLKINKTTVERILENLSYIFETEFPNQSSLFSALKLFINKESNSSQRKLNNDDFESFIDFSFSFNNTVIPFLEQLREIPELKKSHFSFFFDDVQDLGATHKKILNSWIAYRDNKLFSFKLATAEMKPKYITSTNGLILEGHDFVKIDLTRRLFSRATEFSNFAKDVITKRLRLVGINSSIDEYLPISETFKDGLLKGNDKARKLAEKKFPNPTGTQISDYISKNGRAIYFRERNPRANKPVYSGFDIIVDISTGVIRNLLTPLYFMYEKQLSNNQANVDFIPPNVQQEVIIKRSDSFWEKIKDIDSEIEDCTDQMKKNINNFFNKLMIYLKKRLKNEKISEPRALNFIITGAADVSDSKIDEINKIIEISLKSTLLYKRLVEDKKTGEKLNLYIPNRLMMPTHGLDPHGQYSHFPIKAMDFLNAAQKNIDLPFFGDKHDDTNQLELDFG